MADADSDTLYITGLGESSVVWVVDGKDLTLRATVTDTGKYGTGLALDAAAKRLYVTNADGELVTIDTQSNKVLSRKKLDESKEHFFLNISLIPLPIARSSPIPSSRRCWWWIPATATS